MVFYKIYNKRGVGLATIKSDTTDRRHWVTTEWQARMVKKLVFLRKLMWGKYCRPKRFDIYESLPGGAIGNFIKSITT